VSFWDTHSPLEFEDEFKEVKLKVAHPLRHTFKLEVDAKLLGRLMTMSQNRGENISTLLRGWIEERLAAEEKRERKRITGDTESP